MKRTTKSRAETRSLQCETPGQLLDEVLRHLAPPAEARRHFESARVEFLKGIRAVLDSRIERFSKSSKARGQSISIE
jgi:hypothetical protein